MTVTRGLVFGKFAPLTKGHMSFIARAAMQVDRLYLFLSYDQKFVDQQTPWMQSKLGLEDRLKDLKDFIRDWDLENQVIVDYVDETNLPSHPHGWEGFTKLIYEKQPFVKFTHVFSSEPSYGEYFEKHFPDAVHVVIDADRQAVPISATEVRNDLLKNWTKINPSGRGRFVKKVAIVGVESTGKTTMTKQLAKHFKADFTPEVGRDICEEEYHSSEALMKREDYIRVALEHRSQENLAVEWAKNCVTFSDTTNLITHFSAVCAGKASIIDPYFHAISKEEGDNFYDLVLYLEPDVPWVADPLRLQDTPEKRKETNAKLDMMVRHCYNQVKVVYISGDDYNSRLQQAIKAVNELINSKGE